MRHSAISKSGTATWPELRFFAIGLGVFLVDQLTKAWAAQNFSITVNQGISFGLLAQLSPEIDAVMIMALVVSVGYFLRHYVLAQPVWFGCLVGGAISNLFDRLLFAGVRDWLPVPGLGLHNNLADWAIFVACIAIGIHEGMIWLKQRKRVKS